VSDEIKDANLELLIGLTQHLEHAARLRFMLDRLLNLAKSPAIKDTTENAEEKGPHPKTGGSDGP
jgi:hypothetical protein